MKLPSAITSKFGRQLLHVQKASPKIMFVAGVASVVGASVIACRATLKVSDVLESAEVTRDRADTLYSHDNNVDDSVYSQKTYARDVRIIQVRTVLEIAKLYAPAIGLGVVGVGLLTGSHVVLNKRNASLTAAYAAASEAFDKYRDRVRTELGDDKDRNFRYGVEAVEETVTKKDGTGTKTVKHERVGIEGVSLYAKFFDQLVEPWSAHPEYNRVFLQAQQNYANNKLQAQGHLFLNEVYDMLGFEHTGAGAVVGWVWNGDGDNYVDFGIFDDKTGSGAVRDFVNGRNNSVLLDFNVDGVIYNLI